MEVKETVIIPSAKIVPEELQKLGKLPAVIYPVNQRIAFDYLYEQYRERSTYIDVICCENASEVHRRLDGYADGKVRIRDLKKLEDLGHTIYFGLENISGPVVINFADTIVMDMLEEDDAFYCQEDYMSENWTYFDEANGEIVNIYDKRISRSDLRKKLFVGVFRIAESGYFRSCLEQAFCAQDIGMNTFYYGLLLYSRKYPLKAVETDSWFDIGHADKYYSSNLAVKAREFNHISIDKNRGILRKSSEDKDKFIGEIKWYLKLPGDVEYVRPRIFDYSLDYDAPYVSMEYYAYHTVHELFLYCDLNYQQWVDIFKRILFVYHDFQKHAVQSDNITASLRKMYLSKTLQRFDVMQKEIQFQNFFELPITVNGVKYKSLNKVTDILKKVIPEYLYDVDQFHIIHGDLCFTNIMIDSNFSFVKLIDPRGNFGDYDIYGDSRYELAKLLHSMDGKYDFIIKDMFTVEYELKNAVINYKIHDRKCSYDVYKIFLDVFKEEVEEDLEKIELIEALLFLTMIPLHNENRDHQMVMLATGLEILDRVTDIKERNDGKENDCYHYNGRCGEQVS